MSRTGSMFRMRWPFLAAAGVIVAVAIAAGSMFAANSSEQPVQQAAAAQVQLDLTDPGLYADPQAPRPAAAEPGNPSQPPLSVAAVAEPVRPDPDPGAGQVVSEGSGALASWLAARPANMGSFSTQDAIIATDLDVEWMLYQAVENGTMTEDESDMFRAWFGQRPTAEEAPELLNHLPPEIQVPGGDGFSGTDIRSLKSR